LNSSPKNSFFKLKSHTNSCALVRSAKKNFRFWSLNSVRVGMNWERFEREKIFIVLLKEQVFTNTSTNILSNSEIEGVIFFVLAGSSSLYSLCLQWHSIANLENILFYMKGTPFFFFFFRASRTPRTRKNFTMPALVNSNNVKGHFFNNFNGFVN
jgi:hypothetical protein